MAETDSMFSAYGSIFDAATADNVGVRDRALQVAQLQPGRATVYGAHQAGGMLMQNLAGMAGMKTAEQQKAETITSIMKESAGLDPNDPSSARLLAQKFIQASLPGIGQKFIERARTMDVKNQELALSGRGLDIEEEKVDIMGLTEERLAKKTESDIKTQESYLKLDWGKHEHTQWKDEEYLNLATDENARNQAKFEYQQKQDEILNAIREGELELSKARSLLEANDFEFRKARALIEDSQWDKDYDLKALNDEATRNLQIAQKDDIIIKTEAYTENNNIANALKEAQTKSIEMETKLAEKGLEMPSDGEFIMQSIGDGKEQLMRFDVDKGTYVEVLDAEGQALGLANVASQEWGMNVEEQRVYDNIWDQYKQRYYVGNSFGDGHWKEDYPDFYDWAADNVGEQALAILVKGQGGLRGDYQKKLEAEYNNRDSNDDTTVAVVMPNEVTEEGQAETDVKVFNVDYKLLNKAENPENPAQGGYNVSMTALKDVPETIDGVENTLTNGQYITSLMQQGEEEKAIEYIDTLAVAKSTTADTKNVTTYTYKRFKGIVTDKMKESGKYVKQGGLWYTKKAK